MRAAFAIPAAGLLAVAAVAAAQQGAERRDFPVGPFESVRAAGSHNVIIMPGTRNAVRAEGSRETLDRLDIRVEDGRLVIGTRERGLLNWSRDTGRATIRVVTPRLTEAALAGSGNVRIGQVRGERFSGSLAGSGDLSIDSIEVGAADFAVSGSGDLGARGRARDTRVRVAGSGDVDLTGFETRTARISIAGSGDVALRATERVEASIAGSGDVRVTGPARCTANTRGSGRVRCEG